MIDQKELAKQHIDHVILENAEEEIISKIDKQYKKDINYRPAYNRGSINLGFMIGIIALLILGSIYISSLLVK